MVQDASYFSAVLRSKVSEITAEIARMRSEVDKATKDSTVLGQYERHYEGLIKEVRSLEGDLADYNLAMDKSRTSMVGVRVCACALA
jgi:intraflagellar transport protein 74